jgi:hypothetical protein
MKKITQEELDQILQQHQLWLDSNEAEGPRHRPLTTPTSATPTSSTPTFKAPTSKCADLQDANLRYANLQGANLYDNGADLQGADLQGAGLDGAYLDGADLRAPGSAPTSGTVTVSATPSSPPTPFLG